MKLQDILENDIVTYNPNDLDKILKSVLQDEGGDVLMAAWNDGDEQKIIDALEGQYGHEVAVAAVDRLFNGKADVL